MTALRKVVLVFIVCILKLVWHFSFLDAVLVSLYQSSCTAENTSVDRRHSLEVQRFTLVQDSIISLGYKKKVNMRNLNRKTGVCIKFNYWKWSNFDNESHFVKQLHLLPSAKIKMGIEHTSRLLLISFLNLENCII